MSGKSSDKFNLLRNRLLKILSNIEAKIDFPEDDLPKDILNNIHLETKSIKDEIEKILNDQKLVNELGKVLKLQLLVLPM